MITDSDISYAESMVRRAREALDLKKETGSPEELLKLEAELKLKEQNLRDLQSRKRNVEDQERREKEQKERDDRRKRLA